MSGYNYGRRNSVSLLIIIVLILLFAVPVLGVLADSGFFLKLWVNVAEAFPFGHAIAELAVRMFTTLFSTTVDTQEYLSNLSQGNSVAAFMQDFCKLCLSAILFEAVTNFGDTAMELQKDAKGWRFVQKAIWHMFSGLVCAVISGLLLKFAWAQINRLSVKSSHIWTNLITVIVLVGAVAIYVLVKHIGMGASLVYVVLKLVAVNFLSLLLSYLFLLNSILFLSEKAYTWMFGGYAVWALLAIILIGIDMAVERVF